MGHNFERGSHKDNSSQIWFSSFREDYLNVIFYIKKMSNLHNPYKSAELKISQINPKYL